MYLKSIEVHGFKSFANKILFEFHNGITGIVGPNGSGKSNVADAVRWVLGEQRAKQLRGGNMQDVIFSGTENRKPLSYAMVAITLDNADHQLPIDFEEVTIARKLYRSGESEYLINGSVCRLKDVNELFYDTGIGKEGYSIIGQGQIDKILSGKPEERRELFDEAAGIVKFKRRKNMSVKKLEEERQNLVRVTDILSELEKQIGPLEKQSAIAKEYLKKKESLKTYDINMFLLETLRLKEEIQQLESTLSNAQQELDQTTAQYENTKQEYEKIELEIDEMDANLERSKRQLNETTLLKQQLVGQIELLKEQINTARTNDEHLEQRSKAILEELELKETQLSSIEKEKYEMEQEIKEKAAKEQQAKADLVNMQTRIAELSSAIETEKNQIMEILGSRSSTKAKIQKFDTMLEQIEVQKSAINQKLILMKSDSEEHQTLLTQFEQELKVISDQILKYVSETESYNQKIKQLQNQISMQSDTLRQRQSAYHKEASRLESLRNLTERYDGYGNSIRKVMEKRTQESGILGVVADLIQVEKQYEIAVETALGGSIQNIVTDTEHTAKRMIQYLKQNKFGRATFLPLTSMKNSSGMKQTDALKEPGVIGLAHTLVHVESQYESLAENLLGRTIVVKQIEDGIVLARKYRQSLRIVTLEGELINPGGAMTGGAFKNTSNLLSRRREIEELEQKVQQLHKEIQSEEIQIEEWKKERTESYSRIEELKEKLQNAYVVQNTAKLNVNQIHAKKEEAKASALQIRTQQSELEQQIKEIQENQESILVELEISEKMEADYTKQIEQQQKELEQERNQEQSQLHLVETLHLAYANLEQKLAFALENELRIQEEISQRKENLLSLSSSKGEASLEIQKKEDQIEELQQTIEQSQDLFVEIQSEIDRYTAEKEQLNQNHKKFFTRREDFSRHMSNLDKEIFRLTSKKESLEEASEKQMNYMWDEYELTYNMALAIRDETLTDLAFMKKQISTLKNEIRALGSVNVNAIEDYKNVSERYEFLKTQHSDLIEAEATLVKIIEELDNAMRKQFRQQFQEISLEFDKVFKQLFGGGKATLELMDEEDILEAGIRIIAQPPGKKLQNMMQLSGGEKALTAISLLFAIQNLKPSPFCLLDEIEAALDDSNVDRYAKYLHKLTKHTQFIVITHRRGTMTAADRLYGITMQEKGVSTLVSVDLLEKELEN